MEKKNILRFKVFTAVTMKNAVFWDVMPCRSCVNRRFGGTYRLHLQGGNIRERGTNVSRWLQSVFWDITTYSSLQVNRCSASYWFLLWLIIRPWRRVRHVPPKRPLTFNGLHGVISLNIRLFLVFLFRTGYLSLYSDGLRDERPRNRGSAPSTTSRPSLGPSDLLSNEHRGLFPRE
jgi:hypothetical protein